MNKYKGNDEDGNAINEPVFINFAAFDHKAKALTNLEKGARIYVELTPYNKVNKIDGKNYQTVEYNCKTLHIIDWPEREDGTSYREGTK